MLLYISNHILTIIHTDGNHTDGPYCQSHYNGLLYRLHWHWYLWTVSNYTLIISHTDGNHTDTGTFPTKHANIYENCWRKKKKDYLSKNPIAKLRPHQMTGASQRASRAITRERQNSNKLFSMYLWLFFFFGWSHSVWDIACYKIMLFFFPPRRCFWV